MFNSLYGNITGKTPNQIFLDTGGIEWDIAVAEKSSGGFPPVGDNARIFVWLYHREDAVKLFGFVTEEERDIFLELQKVEGIGPRAALKILSGISVSDLVTALKNADISRLEKISGIGRKTAQKMLLALQNTLVTPDVHPSYVSGKSAWEDVVAALVNMGYDRRQCEQVVIKLSSGLDPALSSQEQEEQLFRMAVLELSK